MDPPLLGIDHIGARLQRGQYAQVLELEELGAGVDLDGTPTVRIVPARQVRKALEVEDTPVEIAAPTLR